MTKHQQAYKQSIEIDPRSQNAIRAIQCQNVVNGIPVDLFPPGYAGEVDRRVNERGGNRMETPDRIYLIDMGEDVVWCDSPDPHPDMDPDDAIAYVRESQLSEAREEIERLNDGIKQALDEMELMIVAHNREGGDIRKAAVSGIQFCINILKIALKPNGEG